MRKRRKRIERVAEWTAWGIRWSSSNRLDGTEEYLQGAAIVASMSAEPLRGCTGAMLFRSREECRRFIEDHYGYIRDRKDLHVEPFGWKMPRAVRVEVRVKDLGTR